MNERIKELWVQALRTNLIGDKKIKKGKGALAPEGEHSPERCCLGVLTDLAILEGVPVPKDWPSGAVLPREVVNWAELDNSMPSVPYGGFLAEEQNLGVLNDGYDASAGLPAWSFKRIADKIERHL